MKMLGTATISMLLFAANIVASAESPNWIYRGAAAEEAKVVEVIKDGEADMVIINRGLNGNFRIGAVCGVVNPKTLADSGSIIIVESDAERSVALIIEGKDITASDTVQIRPANLK